ncbi:MAG: phosphoribosylformimino-5-aminoimidazole carboxamide ribotide isomerase [Oscillospiraceae bacterium]|nr:phosphoribosylformimino-5-aminoimidazole carboxamide ribotide isomerase [Oscillospiraceae bacterium]
MNFRPCIDIHNGKVKQIVGGSLADAGNAADENFVSEYDAGFYAELYKSRNLKGGHIIILNAAGSEFYEADRQQAFRALSAYSGGLQVGGGINADNAADYLNAGASHVIVTSYVFKDGAVNFDNLKKLTDAVGKDKLVLDLSCRKKEDGYYIVTDRWQKFTDVKLNEDTLDMFSSYCDEFLIHAVDVEGKARGIEKGLAEMLGGWGKITLTYAGGIGSYADLDILNELGRGKINFTVGSALDIFGGTLDFEKIAAYGR